MKKFVYRILSVVLALLMIFSSCMVVLADEVLPEADAQVPEPVLEQPDEDPPNAEQDEEELTEIPSEKEPAEDLTEQVEEPVPEEEPTEELAEEPAELPYGFVGMPEGYALSEQELDAKALLTELKVLEALAEADPEIDYIEGQVVMLADSMEYAQMAAEAYNGEVLSYDYGVAVIGLTDATVEQAVEAAADLSLALPAVDPNWITWVEPEPEEAEDGIALFAAGQEVPIKQSWESWYYGLLEDDDDTTNPDSWLTNPDCVENNKYQWMHDMVNSYEAWGSSTGKGVTVAIIDSGVRATHKELKNRVEISAVAGLATEPYGNHGTHVAGIIAAEMGNGYMGAGIAPDAKILSLRVVDNAGGIANNNLTIAINQAVYQGADIINLSLGSYNPTTAHQTAINRAVEEGVVVIAAIGNDGTNIKCYPAAYDNVIAVSAVDKDGSAATFSDFGDWSDLSAPGVDIWSTYASSDSSSGKMSGTSQAGPVAAGVAALYLSRNPDATPAEVEAALIQTAAKASSKEIGGIVDAGKLFEQEREAPSIAVSYEGTDYASGDEVPFHAGLRIARGEDDFILFTVNGKTPSVKDGEVVNGFVYDSTVHSTVADLVELCGAPLDKAFTLKAIGINGQGIVGKVASFKMICGYNPDVEDVKITADRTVQLLAGKSIALAAVVQPATADPAVLWSVDLNGMAEDSVKMDAQSGKLTAKTGVSGSVTVRATASNGLYDEIAVQIGQPIKAARMAIEAPPKTIALPKQGQQADPICLNALVYDSKGNRLEDTACVWSSSKPSVLSVDPQTGELQALTKGSASITCKALDGSGKSVRCTITVTQPVEEIILSGNAQITVGGSTSMKAQVLPAAANNKKVVWSIDEASLALGAKISSSGRLTLPKTFALSTVDVTATSADGISETMQLIVLSSKAKTVAIGSEDARAEYTSKGILSKATIYSVDVTPSYTMSVEDQENRIVLTAAADNGAAIGWTSSNPKVAVVDENGIVTARKAGTTKINATALDGSGRKASVTIKVVVPASSVSFSTTQSGFKWNGQQYYIIGSGKTASIKTTLGNAYGTPTNKKIDYELYIYMLDHDTGDPSDEASTDSLFNMIVDKKLVKISSSGKLTVSRNFKSFWETYCDGMYEVAVDVVGFTADGAANNYLTFLLTPYLTEKLLVSSELVDYTRYEPAPMKEITISRSSKPKVYLYSNSYWITDYLLTSSDPSVVGVAGQKTTYDSDYDVHHITLVSGSKPGKATITAKANDGSGKTYKFTVTVA